MAMAVDESKNFKDMYEGLTKGDIAKVLTQYEKLPATLLESSTVFDDTPLHIAIYMDHENMAREILIKQYLDKHRHNDLILKKNSKGDTVLHEVATKNMVNLARDLLDNVPELLSISNNLGEKPLFKTADKGQLQMFNILSLAVNQKHKDDLDQHLTRKDKTNILHMAIVAEYFDLAYLIAKRYPNLVDKGDRDGKLGLQLLSNNPSAFISSANYGLLKRLIFKYYLQPGFSTFENIKEKEGYKKEDQKDFYQLDSIEDEELYNPKTKGRYKKWPPTNSVCMCIARGWPMMKTIYKEFRKHESAFRLAKLLIKQDTTWQQNDSKKEEGESSLGASHHPEETVRPTPPTSLLTATTNGIVEIVKEILRVYPQAVEHVNEEGQNILHIAIKYRQLEIFNFVKKMKVAESRLVKNIDTNGYTILHQVGNMSNYSGGSTLPGPALHLQEELHWLERVRKIVPPNYVMLRSTKNEMIKSHYETADELFLRNNDELFKKARRTSESCSTIAVLIASVASVAAYTIPGGTDKKTGVPIFLHDSFFTVFIAMDVLSLVSSLASVVMFLSILTSPFQLQDFRDSLPRKLTLGFTFLFISVAATMLAFAATIMLTIFLKKRWITTLSYCLAFLPVTLFAILQYPLYLAFKDTMKYTLITIKNSFPALPCSTTGSSIYNTD